MASIERLREALRGRYSILDVVGRGGSATVFRGQDLKFGREVAIKVLRADLAEGGGAARFLAEVEITARLQHPHILPLLDSGRAAGHLYLVTPFVQGSTLADLLRIEGWLPVPDALRLAIALSDALAYAHHQGVIHLDIKPANILLSNGHPVLSDFGIARAASDSLAGWSAPGRPVGTPEYMSPEQVAGEHPLDGRSDVYSLSCLLYEMLVGRPPFGGATAASVMARQQSSDPPPVSGESRGRVTGLDALIQQGLAKEAAGRFASADEFSGALRRVSADVAVRSRRVGGVSAAVAVALCVGLAWSAFAAAVSSPPAVDPPVMHLQAETPAPLPAAPLDHRC